MKRTLCILLSLILILSLLAGCGGAKPTVKTVSGTYHLKSLNGRPPRDVLLEQIRSEEEMAAWLQMLGISMDDLGSLITLSLNENGTCRASEFGQTGSGTWTLEGSTVRFSMGGRTLTASWADGVLTVKAPENDGSGIEMMELQKD